MFFLYQKILPFLIYPLISLLLSLIFTRICIKLLPFLGVMDFPGGRHIHEKPVPRGGGIAIIAAFSIVTLIYFFSPFYALEHGVVNGLFALKIAIPAAMLIICGLLDDKYRLKARYKLAVQIFACILCWFLGISLNSIFGIQLPGIVSFIVTVAWMFAFINAFGLIDGLDGLATGLGIVAAVCMGVFFLLSQSYVEAVLVLCLGAACLGFLRYNFYPARIFMGDTGSMFVGFMFGVIGIVSSYKAMTITAVLTPFLAAGIPMFDGFLALWRRGGRNLLLKLGFKHNLNIKIFGADIEHLHHRILKKYGSQRQTTLMLYSFGVVSGALAIVFVLANNVARGVLLIVLLLTTISAIRQFAGIELWDSTQIALYGLRKPRRSLLVSLSHPIIDISFILLALIVTLFLFHGGLDLHQSLRLFYYKAACSMFPIVFVLNLSGVYRIFWLRASAVNYIYLLQMIFIGACCGFVLTYFFTDYSSLNLFIAEYALFYTLVSGAILGERMLLRHMNFAFNKNIYLAAHADDELTKVLIYGAGNNTRFYLADKDYNIANDPVNVIGIIDDEPVLRKKYVYNCKVLGIPEELPEIFKRHCFDKIVVTIKNVSTEKRTFIEKFCKDNNVHLSEAYFIEK